MINGKEFDFDARTLRHGEKPSDVGAKVPYLSREWATGDNPRSDNSTRGDRQKGRQAGTAPEIHTRRSGLRRDVACKRQHDRRYSETIAITTVIVRFIDRHFLKISVIGCTIFLAFRIGYEIARNT